ncbi:hypothetical protein XAC3810_660078 [Xanthomonas citri pv. citri]|nr:hypothetical protein XAC3810_660078 [Xanthomonas citri pv. citri]CEE47495.1 hypothetical protein XAC2911_710105 [Xanthomonas citri pv. citri]CEE73633.1 hypothetical protein XACW160_660077 [Xanthomonas citri pv. citri]CEF21018.1 hypothetical protein XACJK2_1360043 [Xanthomonas citri pv. citri]CEH40144.1 hypothetical protein XAC3615_10020005 [Xanthomonas citri pv. citri]
MPLAGMALEPARSRLLERRDVRAEAQRGAILEAELGGLAGI